VLQVVGQGVCDEDHQLKIFRGNFGVNVGSSQHGNWKTPAIIGVFTLDSKNQQLAEPNKETAAGAAVF
jgi:hypothetical protein